MAIIAAGITAVGMVGAAAASGAPSAPVMTNPILTTDGLFDNSGWNIAFPGARIDSNRSQQEGGPVLETDSYVKWFVLAGAFLIIWKTMKKSN